MHRVVIIVVFVSLAVQGAMGAAAQEASPAAEIDNPAPEECTVAPRTEDEFRALFEDASSVATPLASPEPGLLPAGEPVDDQTVDDINTVWRHYVACVNAGDLARAFALTSDQQLRRIFVYPEIDAASEDQLIEIFMAPPSPLSSNMAVPFVPLEDARLLDDGRVAAVDPGETGQRQVLIFIKVGDQWRFDDQFDLTQEGTPEAAAPPVSFELYG